jgi:hypothetical protein
MDQLRRMRWAGHIARMGEKMNVYNIFVGKSKMKKPLGQKASMCRDNIKIDLNCRE